jgi:hypothetical protein
MSKFYYDKNVYLIMEFKGNECLVSNFLKMLFFINPCERDHTNDFSK